MPVVRNPQFYFREGFCWTDINSTYLKSRLKEQGVFDVVSMSLFSQVSIPNWYFVSMINTKFISFYVDNFINNTSHFQINDARQLPIIIPTEQQLLQVKHVFLKAYAIQKKVFAKTIDIEQAQVQLLMLQKQIDILVDTLYAIKCSN